jgi:hypothetical protein
MPTISTPIPTPVPGLLFGIDPNVLAAAAQIISSFLTVVLLIYAVRQLQAVRAQLRVSSEQDLTAQSNQHNWDLWTHWDDLPPMLPAWHGLDRRGAGWRVLCLNHLNLLQLAWREHNDRSLNEADYQHWKVVARYWFRDLRPDAADPEIQQGFRTLASILGEEGAYGEDFCLWMVQEQIVPTEAVCKVQLQS